ncbi:MAG: lamin tail domain-containing protein [Patescibacteria group bacterium]
MASIKFFKISRYSLEFSLRLAEKIESFVTKIFTQRVFMKTIAVISILFFARMVSAQVLISEIKYTGNEWIEISNSGASADLSLWKFFEGGTNHKLKSVQGDVTLASGGYAIIADDATAFLTEHSGFSGILFDSSFSLLDVGETISIKSSDTNTIDTVSYTGIKGSKNSTQKIGGVWSEAIPTPGVANAISPGTSVAPQNTATMPVANTNTSSAPTSSQMTAQAGPQTRVVLAGAPIIFEGKIAGLENGYSAPARTTWSFGDGASAEGSSVSHTYYYPGEYTAVLDVVSGSMTATDRMLVRVVLPVLSLNAGGDTARSFFTIQNRGGDEIDLSGWQVASAEKIFTFPKNTILGVKKNATFASEVTGLATPEGSVIELRFPNGSRVETKNETATAEAPAPKAEEKPKVKAVTQPRTASIPQQQEASAIVALPDTQTPLTQKEGSLWPWYIGAAFLGVFALGGIRLTREKEERGIDSSSEANTDDFEIVEESDEDKKADIF